MNVLFNNVCSQKRGKPRLGYDGLLFGIKGECFIVWSHFVDKEVHDQYAKGYIPA